MTQGSRTPQLPRELSRVRPLVGELMHTVPGNFKNEIKFKKIFGVCSICVAQGSLEDLGT